MPDPESDGSEMDGGEEVSGELVVARGDASEVFEFVEEALDEVAPAIEAGIDRALRFAVALCRDVGNGAVCGQEFEDGVGIVTAVGNGIAGGLEAVDQGRDGGLVGGLAWREQQPDGQAVGIDHAVDLGAQSSTRTADGVIRAPFFPPAACWWARTIEESMR